jgi:hypothetical protein
MKTAAQKLAAAGHRTLAVRCDVSDDVQVAAIVDRTVAEFSPPGCRFQQCQLDGPSLLRSPTAPAMIGTA